MSDIPVPYPEIPAALIYKSEDIKEGGGNTVATLEMAPVFMNGEWMQAANYSFKSKALFTKEKNSPNTDRISTD